MSDTPVLPPARRVQVADNVLLAAAVVGALYFVAHLVTFQYGRDQGIYAVVARALVSGGAPYQAAWDFKPPAIFFQYALSRVLFGSSMTGIRVMEVLGLISLFPAFMILSRRFLSDVRAGILGACLAIYAYVPLGYWHTAQPESFGLFALAWALVLTTWTPHSAASFRRQRWAWGGAAALFTWAALLKPPLGGGYLVALLWVILQQRNRRSSEQPAQGWAWPLACFVAGPLVPLGALLSYFVAAGAIEDLRQALFVFAPQYTALSYQDTPFHLLMWKGLRLWLVGINRYNLFGLVPLLLLRPWAPRQRSGLWLIGGVVAMLILGIALQGKFFRYHYASALPLTGLLAGWGLWKAWLRVHHHALGWLGFAAVATVVQMGLVPGLPDNPEFYQRSRQRQQALFDSSQRQDLLDQVYTQGDTDAGENRRAAEWIAQNTPADSSLFVWGFEPVIYELAPRRPATRWVYNYPLRVDWARDWSLPLLMEDLRADPPHAIVILHNDPHRNLTGNRLDSAADLRRTPQFVEWIRERYEPGTIIGDLEIVVRKR